MIGRKMDSAIYLIWAHYDSCKIVNHIYLKEVGEY